MKLTFIAVVIATAFFCPRIGDKSSKTIIERKHLLTFDLNGRIIEKVKCALYYFDLNVRIAQDGSFL